MGGNRIHVIDHEQTYQQQQIVYDQNRLYEDREKPANILSFSIKYHINKKKYSSVWGFDLINALAYREFRGYSFNIETQSIEAEKDLSLIPNISYKIEF